MFRAEDGAAYFRARAAYYRARASEMRARAEEGKTEEAHAVFRKLEESWLRLAETAEQGTSDSV